MSADLTPAGQRLARLIASAGAIPISLFMAEANGAYYGSRDPLGAGGDFITAPEVSQMFGEMIGLWCADMWMRAGEPANCLYVELGPGRGTLAVDALRAMARFGFQPAVHMVETSESLIDKQLSRLPHAIHHRDIATLPVDQPMIVVANEFFDALPIRQFVAQGTGWRERLVAFDGESFRNVAGNLRVDALIPAAIRGSRVGSVVEVAPAGTAIAAELAHVIAAAGGAMLVIDYGYEGPAVGDTLQAMRGHQYADVLSDPGNVDLSAHVDFAALGAAMSAGGVAVHGPVGQGAFLGALGLHNRAEALMNARHEAADIIRGQYERLVAPDQMGTLFRVMAATAPHWPQPEGFA